MIAPITLRAYLDKYVLERDLAASTIKVMKAHIAVIERWLKRPATMADLDADTLNKWIVDSLADGRNRQTLASYRVTFVVLRNAADIGGKVRTVKRPRLLPRAWKPDEMIKLLAACTALRGRMRDRTIARSAFWRAFVLVAYHSGLRLGDLLALTQRDFEADGTLTVVMKKTGDVLVGKLNQEAIDAIAEITEPGREYIFRMDRRHAQSCFQVIVTRAGLEGSIKRLRATGATAVEIVQAGAATAFLGHRTAGLARKHYIDPRQVQPERLQPPPLTLAGQARETKAQRD